MMASDDQVHVTWMRRSAVAGVLFFIVTALVISATTAAYAKSPPTATELAQKLVKAKICTTVQPAKISAVNATAVTCSKADETILVSAFKKKSTMLSDVKAFQGSVCQSLLAAMPNFSFTNSYVAGPTWYAWYTQTGSKPAPLKNAAKALGGQVKKYTCKATAG
jgi:hypothetical protein